VDKLNLTGANVQRGGYGGWIRFMFSSSGKPRGSIKMKYHHGSGRSAQVTRGVIETNRQAVFLPDADVVWNGHNHQGYWLPISRERISNKGIQYHDIVHFIRTPGYKAGWEASMGFDVEKIGAPTPIGAVWMRLIYNNGMINMEFTPAVE
jgi:hypothetical protein